MWVCEPYCSAQGYGSQIKTASLGLSRRLRTCDKEVEQRHFVSQIKITQCKQACNECWTEKGTYLNGDLWLWCVLLPSGSECACCACAQRWVRSDFSWRQESQTSMDVVHHKITICSLNNAICDSPYDCRATGCYSWRVFIFGDTIAQIILLLKHCAS